MTPAVSNVERGQRAMHKSVALWRGGLGAEANEQMQIALRAALDAWLPAPPPPAEELAAAGQAESPDPRSALKALARAGYRHVDRLEAAVVASGGRDFEWIWAEAERLLKFTVRHTRTPELRLRRRRRAGVWLAFAIALACLLAFRLWGRPRGSASAVYSPEHPAAYAVDGISSTEWLLPDRTAGWLEVKFPWARKVRTVRLVNSHNRHHMDRAAERVRVTAFAGPVAIASAPAKFHALTEERSVLDVDVAGKGITHVKIEIESYFGNGGGLAEIEVR